MKVAQDFDWAMIPGVNDSKKLRKKTGRKFLIVQKKLPNKVFRVFGEVCLSPVD